jgi:hypothetical protein
MEDRPVADLHPVAAGGPCQAWLYREAPRAVRERQPRVDGLLAGEAPARVDAVNEDLAQRGVRIDPVR